MSNDFKKILYKKFAIGQYCRCTHQDKKNWDGVIVKLGHPFRGRDLKMGQSRTWDGWGVQMSLKKWDVLYGRSLTENKTLVTQFNISICYC